MDLLRLLHLILVDRQREYALNANSLPPPAPSPASCDIFLTPATCQLGALRRWENGMDPNRDFPYSTVPETCMTTITARQVV